MRKIGTFTSIIAALALAAPTFGIANAQAVEAKNTHRISLHQATEAAKPLEGSSTRLVDRRVTLESSSVSQTTQTSQLRNAKNTRKLPKPVSNTSKRFTCKNELAQIIYRAGFRGENIREAWAIAMRESNGIETTISPWGDYGIFQFNMGAWGNQRWWNTDKLLTADYNAKIAFRMSKGGRSWIPWGIKDGMEFDRSSYNWSDDQFYSWVIEPYKRYYSQYPC